MFTVALLTFAAVFLLIFSFWSIIRRAQLSPTTSLKQRLRRMEESEWDSQPKEKARNIFQKESALERMIHRLPFQGPMERLLEHSGTRMSPTFFTLLNIASFATGFLPLLLLKSNLPLASGVGSLAAFIPTLYLHYHRTKRRGKFDEQIPDILIMISRSLQAGHSLAGAVEMVGQMMPEPAGGLFRMTYEQQKLGMRISEAVASLPERIDSIDLHFFVTIVKMNNEIGGGLAETLDKLSETIRARLQLRRQVRVHTSEGRISGYILAGLPISTFAIIYILNPGYLEPFFTNKSCQYLLYAAALAQVVGLLVIRNIVKIRI